MSLFKANDSLICEIESSFEREFEQNLSQESKKPTIFKNYNKMPSDQVIFENNCNLLSEKIILGMVQYKKWGRTKNQFFSLDVKKGRMLCYKKIDSKNKTTYYTIVNANFIQVDDQQRKDSIFFIKTKKGKTFRLELLSNKDVDQVKKYFTTCFGLKKKDQADKGFFAMLGKGKTHLMKTPFNVISGILVSEKQQKQELTKNTPNKIYADDIKNSKKNQTNTIPVSGLFFGTSNLINYILTAVATTHIQNSQEIQKNSIYQLGQVAYCLVFKPIANTLDLITMSNQLNGAGPIQKNVYFNIFKVFKNKKNKKKRSQKTVEKERKIRQDLEQTLDIEDKQYQKILENEQEILFLRKNIDVLQKTDIDQLNIKQLNKHLLDLDDLDLTTKQQEIDQERLKLNTILDFYKKQHVKTKQKGEEDMCEFMVLTPIFEVAPKEEEYMEQMDEGLEEDVVISCERYQERYEGKFLPRVSYKQRMGRNNNEIKLQQGMLPEFRISINPFNIERQFMALSPQMQQRSSAFNIGQYSQSADATIQKSQNTSNNFIASQNCLQLSTQQSPFNEKSINTQQDLQIQSIQSLQKNHVRFQVNEGEDSKEDELNNVSGSNRGSYKQQDTDIIQQPSLIKSCSNASGINFDNHVNGDPVIGSQTGRDSRNGSIYNKNGQGAVVEEEEEEDEEDDGGKADAICSAKDEVVYSNLSYQEHQKLVQNLKPFDCKDEVRVQEAYKSGGKVCKDKDIINTLRSVGKYVVKEIGRKIISGDFNLTQVSFPIKAMCPRSALQTSLVGTCLFPTFMSRACIINDKVERLKYVITATLGNFPVANTFLKPLNPILGETFEARYFDGTQLYSEQISHHPPVNCFLVFGPNKIYTYSGYYLYDAKAGLNSLTVRNRGYRKVQFADGQSIKYNFAYELYSGTFMGTMKHETLGDILFKDEKNNIECTITIGKVKKKPSDYFDGEIKVNGQVKSKVYGSYLGFIEFDGLRYWDFRYVLPTKIQIEESQLMSDHQKRTDRYYLKKGNLKLAQKEKERYEENQRNDAKLRKAYQDQQEKLNKQLNSSNKKKK